MIRRFEITDAHIKLIQNAYTGWDDCEFGAPGIDCKRPYGNSGVLGSMARILGLRSENEDEYDMELTDEEESTLCKLHKELETVLEIGFRTLRFEPGVYVASDQYSSDWKKEAIKQKAA